MAKARDHELLRHTARTWQRLGELDPLWAVLTVDEGKGGRWDVDAFFETGRALVDEVCATLDALPVERTTADRALDFGCGAGRISRALASRYGTVDGVDIAPAMVAKARELNAAVPNARFHVNERADLSLFDAGTFDLVLSTITLQHMPPHAALGYVGEFVRVLTPTGVAVFDTASVSRRQRIKQAMPRALTVAMRTLLHRGRPTMEMFGVEPRDVETAVQAAGGHIVHRDWFWHGWRYFVVRS